MKFTAKRQLLLGFRSCGCFYWQILSINLSCLPTSRVGERTQIASLESQSETSVSVFKRKESSREEMQLNWVTRLNERSRGETFALNDRHRRATLIILLRFSVRKRVS